MANDVSSLNQENFPSPRIHHLRWNCFLLLDQMCNAPEWFLVPLPIILLLCSDGARVNSSRLMDVVDIESLLSWSESSGVSGNIEECSTTARWLVDEKFSLVLIWSDIFLRRFEAISGSLFSFGVKLLTVNDLVLGNFLSLVFLGELELDKLSDKFSNEFDDEMFLSEILLRTVWVSE